MGHSTPSTSFPIYLFKASAWVAAAFFLNTLIASCGPWLLPVAVFLLAAPLAMGGVYRTTIRKIRFLEIFARRGRIAKIFSGRLIPLLLWMFYAVVTTFFMLIGFQFFSPVDWFLFLAVIPVFYTTYRVFYHLLEKEIKPYMVTSMTASLAVWCTPLIMLAIFAFSTCGLDMPAPRYENLESAISAHEEMIVYRDNSALTKSASEWMAIYGGIRAYAAVQAGYSELPLTLLAHLFFTGYMIFFNAANILTFCLVPSGELKRIILPLTPDAEPPPPGGQIRKWAFYPLTAAILLMSFAAAFFYLEARFSERPGLGDYHATARDKARQYVERIDDTYVAPGTITQIEAYKTDMMRDLAASAYELEAAIDRAFDDMVLRVDDFLDWYYSLFAEYARIAHWVSGSAEAHLSAMLEKHLKARENFQTVHTRLDLLLAQQAGTEIRLQEAARQLVEQHRIHEPADAAFVTRTFYLDNLLDHSDFIGFDFRMLSASTSSGGGFLAGGYIGKKIVENAAGKSMFKASTRAAARLGGARAVGKSGGGAAGAATGAAVGSVVPGGGTVAGAVAGGIAGSIATGLLMDKTLLMAEERYSRAAFREEIISAIEKTRMETKARLYGR